MFCLQYSINRRLKPTYTRQPFADMRFASSIIIGLLAANGLAQTVADPAPEQQPEPSAIADPQPSEPAAQPSAPAAEPSSPSDSGDDDTPQTNAEPTAVAEPTADEPVATGDASQVSDGDQPTATATDSDDDDEATTAAEGTATADGKSHHYQQQQNTTC